MSQLDLKQYEPYISLILRITLGFVFLYSGFGKLTNPNHPSILVVRSMSFIPFDPQFFVFLQGLVETVLAILLIIGFYTSIIGSITAILVLLGIALFDFNFVWKDVALFGSAITLAIQGSSIMSIDHYLKHKTA